MLKRFLITVVVSTLVTGGYFYYLKSTGEQQLAQKKSDFEDIADNTAAEKANQIEPAAGAEPTANVEFSLTDQDGKTVTDKDLKGKKLLVFFGFTSCTDICPVSMAIISEVMNQLEADKNENLQPVFITTDPETDKPAVLKEYLKDYYPKFLALTGPQAELEKVAKAFKAYVKIPEKGSDEDPDHSGLIYYMDANGKYISHFGGDNAAEDIADYISSH